jgi:hypothetical protein
VIQSESKGGESILQDNAHSQAVTVIKSDYYITNFNSDLSDLIVRLLNDDLSTAKVM